MRSKDARSKDMRSKEAAYYTALSDLAAWVLSEVNEGRGAKARALIRRNQDRILAHVPARDRPRYLKALLAAR